MHKTQLFEARTGGYFIYRIPGLLATPSGVVLATCEARHGQGGDYDDIDILLRRSLDGGLTWEAPRVLVAHTQYGPGPIQNFVMIADRTDGSVHAIYCYDYARVFYMKSTDDGATFSPAWAGSGVPRERMMPAEDLAQMVLAICQLSRRTVVEEITLRPQLGDL